MMYATLMYLQTYKSFFFSSGVGGGGGGGGGGGCWAKRQHIHPQKKGKIICMVKYRNKQAAIMEQFSVCIVSDNTSAIYWISHFELTENPQKQQNHTKHKHTNLQREKKEKDGGEVGAHKTHANLQGWDGGWVGGRYYIHSFTLPLTITLAFTDSYILTSAITQEVGMDERKK